jgi:putative transposase
VERNALRAGLVARAADWRWSSLWQRSHGFGAGWLDEGPIDLPRNWVGRVEATTTEAEEEAVRRSVARGSPFGGPSWVEETAKSLRLESTLRQRGRPRKAINEASKE